MTIFAFLNFKAVSSDALSPDGLLWGSYGDSSSRLGILNPVRAKTSSGTAHHRRRLTVRHPQFTDYGFRDCHDATVGRWSGIAQQTVADTGLLSRLFLVSKPDG